LRLLFICAYWHGLAKLRLHTDQTLDIIDDTTVRMGAEFRAFVDKTCPSFDTRELARETDARNRREQKEARSQAQTNQSTGSSETGRKVAEPKRKTFSLKRYTYHALGDYGSVIRQFGTSDSFSTEPVRNILSRPLSISCN
jgi:hypothetical protein